jgi:murein L,D-transpeptidase YcbB/YkuD
LKKNFLLTIVVALTITGAYLFSALPPVLAMGKRPVSSKQAKTKDFALPEIEIITRPEADVNMLTKEEPAGDQLAGISPVQVLPAVGQDVASTSRNYRIADIQQALKNAGLDSGPIDGKMGPKTKKAIRDFQRNNNLTVDGVVGKKTWTKLKPFLETPETKTKTLIPS